MAAASRVLVTDAKYKMALAPLRSLTAAGYDVVCGDYDDLPEKSLLATRSKLCGQTLSWKRGEEPAREIASLCRPGDVVLPVGRGTLASFARCPEEAARAGVLVSDPAVLDLADDKGRVQALAAELGIPTPATRLLPPDTVPEEAAQEVRYPCILKYRNGEALGLKSQERYAVVRDRAAFCQAYRRMAALSPDLLCQDYLTGQDVGVAVVMDSQSRPVDFLCYVSRREYPLAGGPTCLCETVFDRTLLTYACTILQAIGFRGIAMLDFKGRPDRPFLLEINPRVWGSAALAEVAESTFFPSYVQAALGEAPALDLATCQPAYRLGARMKFAPHCFLGALAQGRQKEWRAALGDLRWSLSPKVPDGLFRWKDPKPFARYLTNILSGKG